MKKLHLMIISLSTLDGLSATTKTAEDILNTKVGLFDAFCFKDGSNYYNLNVEIKLQQPTNIDEGEKKCFNKIKNFLVKELFKKNENSQLINNTKKKLEAQLNEQIKEQLSQQIKKQKGNSLSVNLDLKIKTYPYLPKIEEFREKYNHFDISNNVNILTKMFLDYGDQQGLQIIRQLGSQLEQKLPKQIKKELFQINKQEFEINLSLKLQIQPTIFSYIDYYPGTNNSKVIYNKNYIPIGLNKNKCRVLNYKKGRKRRKKNNPNSNNNSKISGASSRTILNTKKPLYEEEYTLIFLPIKLKLDTLLY